MYIAAGKRAGGLTGPATERAEGTSFLERWSGPRADTTLWYLSHWWSMAPRMEKGRPTYKKV